MASSGIASRQNTLSNLAAAWRSFGAGLSFDLSINYGLCVIEGCAGMAYVGLRTEAGPRPVCLKHYDVILGPPAKVPA